MSFKYDFSDDLIRIFKKLMKKDKQLYENVKNKINEVANNSDIEHYKNLRYDLKEYKRVHIGSFVLIFKFDNVNQIIHFESFKHHDKIYE